MFLKAQTYGQVPHPGLLVRLIIGNFQLPGAGNIPHSVCTNTAINSVGNLVSFSCGADFTATTLVLSWSRGWTHHRNNSWGGNTLLKMMVVFRKERSENVLFNENDGVVFVMYMLVVEIPELLLNIVSAKNILRKLMVFDQLRSFIKCSRNVKPGY